MLAAKLYELARVLFSAATTTPERFLQERRP
jgi:hypothetical protein